MTGAEVLAPATLDALSGALGSATPHSKLLAGGTDLARAMHQGGCRPDLLIDLSGVADLAFVGRNDGHLRIGAMTTLADLQADPLVRLHAPGLALAASRIGSAQIRNMATVGGNIGNASPCGDTIPALLALAATVRTLDANGSVSERPLEEIVTGKGTTSLSYSEAIVEIVVPVLGTGYHSAFVKIGSRSAVTVARLSVALVVRHDAASGALSDARVALGALGATAFRDARLEALVNEGRADTETAALFCEECPAAVRRAIPGRYSLQYKELAARGLAADAWEALEL